MDIIDYNLLLQEGFFTTTTTTLTTKKHNDNTTLTAQINGIKYKSEYIEQAQLDWCISIGFFSIEIREGRQRKTRN